MVLHWSGGYLVQSSFGFICNASMKWIINIRFTTLQNSWYSRLSNDCYYNDVFVYIYQSILQQMMVPRSMRDLWYVETLLSDGFDRYSDACQSVHDLQPVFSFHVVSVLYCLVGCSPVFHLDLFVWLTSAFQTFFSLAHEHHFFEESVEHSFLIHCWLHYKLTLTEFETFQGHLLCL